MRVLVTGGAGFIGSNIIRVLIDKGYKAYCLDDFSHANFKNIYELPCDVITADIRNESVFKKLPPVNAVIHEAAVTDTTINDDNKMMTVNLGGFKNVLEYCIRKRIPLVYASSAGVYGDGHSPMNETQSPHPLNTYSYSKLMCDRIAEAYFNKESTPLIVGLRYFNVYGPRQALDDEYAVVIPKFIHCILNDEPPPIFGNGLQSRDFTYIDNVVEANILAATVPLTSHVPASKASGRPTSLVFNVANGKDNTVLHLVEVLNKIIGKDIKPKLLPVRAGDVFKTHADISKIQTILGFKPLVDFEEGLRRTVEYWKGKRLAIRG